MTQRYDLVIAGGGPSGSAAAWQAAQTGAKVVVLDKAEFPRAKPCGDGLTARAVSYLQRWVWPTRLPPTTGSTA